METTDKLAKVIRKIVKAEVKKEVRQVLNEITNKKPAKASDFHNGIGRGVALMDNVKPTPTRKASKKEYSKNETLNDILNETAQSMRAPEEYPTMDNKTFTSAQAQAGLPDRNKLASMLGYGDMTQKAAQAGTPTLAEMMPRTNTSGGTQTASEVAPEVANALTRDYSDLMKAINKKKG